METVKVIRKDSVYGYAVINKSDMTKSDILWSDKPEVKEVKAKSKKVK